MSVEITSKKSRNKTNYILKMSQEDLLCLLRWSDKKSEIYHNIVKALMENISLADLIDTGYEFHTADKETITLYKKEYLSNWLGFEIV